MKRIYWVDVPDINKNPADQDQSFVNIAQFDKRKDAIKFAQEHYGADKSGKIQLVTSGRL